MSDLLHKEIIIDNFENQKMFSLLFYGNLMGWTDGDRIIKCNEVEKFIEDEWNNGGLDAMLILMRGVIGSCIIEITSKNER